MAHLEGIFVRFLFELALQSLSLSFYSWIGISSLKLCVLRCKYNCAFLWNSRATNRSAGLHRASDEEFREFSLVHMYFPLDYSCLNYIVMVLFSLFLSSHLGSGYRSLRTQTHLQRRCFSRIITRLLRFAYCCKFSERSPWEWLLEAYMIC